MNQGSLVSYKKLMKKHLTSNEAEAFLKTIFERFNTQGYFKGQVNWDEIKRRLIDNPDKLWSLYQMEVSKGEPSLLFYNQDLDEYLFFDTSKESPSERRSLCYDWKALDSRKKNKPKDNVLDVCEKMGIELLDEKMYRLLQSFDEFDTKTSSWIKTPSKIRDLGGALFCDYRYQTVFVYHNGADSYYSSRGFRGLLRV